MDKAEDSAKDEAKYKDSSESIKKSSLDFYRQEIDTIDRNIIDLLHNRVEKVLKVAEVKEVENLPRYYPEREKNIFLRLKEYNHKLGKTFPNSAIESVFREIISACRSLEKKTKVAYLGPVASFTHAAVLKQFGSSVELCALPTIGDVFKEVGLGHSDYGMVPVENSYEGIVNRTLDMLVDYQLKIYSEQYLQISHCLLSQEKTLDSVTKVYSHSQAFSQCRNWLSNHLPRAEQIETISTSKAASIVEWDKYSAAISSEVASQIYGLNVLVQGIQDLSENITRFLVLSKNFSLESGEDKTSIVFAIRDEVGALMKILSPFDKRNINLVKIESRPSRRKAWDYLFFVDLAAHRSEDRVVEALEELSLHCLSLRVLGSYPKGVYPGESKNEFD